MSQMNQMSKRKKVVIPRILPCSAYDEEETARSVYLLKRRAERSLTEGIPFAWYDEHETAGSVARMKAAHRRRQRPR